MIVRTRQAEARVAARGPAGSGITDAFAWRLQDPGPCRDGAHGAYLSECSTQPPERHRGPGRPCCSEPRSSCSPWAVPSSPPPWACPCSPGRLGRTPSRRLRILAVVLAGLTAAEVGWAAALRHHRRAPTVDACILPILAAAVAAAAISRRAAPVTRPVRARPGGGRHRPRRGRALRRHPDLRGRGQPVRLRLGHRCGRAGRPRRLVRGPARHPGATARRRRPRPRPASGCSGSSASGCPCWWPAGFAWAGCGTAIRAARGQWMRTG